MTRRPSGGPSGVEPISGEQIDELGINACNELFWDGHWLITRSRRFLSVPQTFLEILAAIASVATIATGLNNAWAFLCGRDLHWLRCPAPPAPRLADGLPTPPPG